MCVLNTSGTCGKVSTEPLTMCNIMCEERGNWLHARYCTCMCIYVYQYKSI